MFKEIVITRKTTEPSGPSYEDPMYKRIAEDKIVTKSGDENKTSSSDPI